VIGWVDASAGASGDMLLGALLGAGVPLDVLSEAVTAVTPEPMRLSVTQERRAGLAATRCHVEVADSSSHRGWSDVRALLDGADLDAQVRERAVEVFGRLAAAEATAHGIPLEAVHFHEVGALDAIADVVGVCAGFAHLGLESLVVSPVAVGSGRVQGAHGSLPVPVPAVAELLRGVPSLAGPGAHESCTPTGAALLTTWAASYGPQPPMIVTAVGVGAGGRDPSTHANAVRLLVGRSAASSPGPPEAWVIETNVDDLDPRLWPDVLAALLTAGASDAWLTPILMKKGRPAHTLSVLVRDELRPAVRRELFAQTSTIGVRERSYGKTALDREMRSVDVGGHPVAVKVARLDGEVMNVQPEYDDVVAAATATGRPVKDVLAEAAAAARAIDLGTVPRD
jgi:uncharacterized protein (TIGR00299 family) protein